MKNIIKVFFTFFIAALFFSCKRDISQVSFEGGTAPALLASTTDVRNEPGEESNQAISFNWTNPNYSFTTGISSHDVKYTLQIDTVGGNFSSGKKFETVIARDLSKTYTVGELNSILGNSMVLQLLPRRTYDLEARIVSSLGNNAVPLASNTVAFKVKPFAPPPKVPLPTDGNLWATGNAFASDWANPLGTPYDVTQKFTMLPSVTDYELIVDMKPGGAYKLIQKQGDWSTQYHMITGGTALSGSFEKKDSDPGFPSPDVAGTYKISFNFQLGTYKVEKQ